tara:strand:+ start:107 stop:346 length:240 start_codon:yes stop_codon:yes gene_type:complete
MLEHYIEEIECGLFPTPQTVDQNTPSMVKVRRILEKQKWYVNAREVFLAIKGNFEKKYAPPSLYEEAMGYPIGWTELKD